MEVIIEENTKARHYGNRKVTGGFPWQRIRNAEKSFYAMTRSCYRPGELIHDCFQQLARRYYYFASRTSDTYLHKWTRPSLIQPRTTRTPAFSDTLRNLMISRTIDSYQIPCHNKTKSKLQIKKKWQKFKCSNSAITFKRNTPSEVA